MTIKNSQPNDLSVCFTTNGANLIAASYDGQGVIHTKWFSVEQNFFLLLRQWREDLGHSTDLQTVFRFVPMFFNEQTHIASLPEDAIFLDDRELTVWLNEAALSDTSGANGFPIFESSIETSAYDFARLPERSVTLTEVPRERLHEGLKQVLQSQPLDKADLATLMRDATDDTQPFLLHAVETRLRAVTRALIHTNSDFFSNLTDDETIAVFAFTPEGCGFSLWNPTLTFHTELGEWFNFNFDENEIPPEMDRAQYASNLYLDSVFNFLHDHFYSRVSPEDDNAPAIKISRIFWTATDGLNAELDTTLKEFSAQTNIAVNFVEDVLMEELIVRGLLLAFDSDLESLVPSINLANDITSQNEIINAEERNLKIVSDRKNREKVFACLLLPFVLALAVIIGLWFNNQRAAMSISRREAAAKAEQARLKPKLQARADYEKTLNWYQDVLRQIVSLRQKQTSSLSFAARLDPLYPSTSAFYVSDMKLAPGGLFELKGYTRDEMAVSQFVRALEFAQDDQEARYFTTLTLDFKQGSKLGSGAVIPAVSTGSTLGGNLPDGVSAFLIKGVFSPASVLKPQQPVAAPAPGAPAPPNSQGNSVANTSAPGAPATPVSNPINANTGAK